MILFADELPPRKLLTKKQKKKLDETQNYYLTKLGTDIEYNNNVVYFIIREVFDNLPEYSCTIPTGAYIGKIWKRNEYSYDRYSKGKKPKGWTGWFICEYVPSIKKGHVAIKYRKVLEILKSSRRNNESTIILDTIKIQ